MARRPAEPALTAIVNGIISPPVSNMGLVTKPLSGGTRPKVGWLCCPERVLDR